MAAVRARCVLLTGSNRGIGLELVRQLLGGPQPPTHVFATCRDPEGPRGKVSVRVGAAEGGLRACGCGAAEVRAAGSTGWVCQQCRAGQQRCMKFRQQCDSSPRLT